MKNKNILIVTEYFPNERLEITGGVEARAYYIGRELAKTNEVTIITSWRSGDKKCENIDNMTIIRCGKEHKYTNKGAIFSRLRFAIYAYNTISSLKCDIIFGYNFIAYLPTYFAAKRLNARTIATYHETWIGEWIDNTNIIVGLLGEIWERIVLKLNWDKFIAVSDFTRKQLIKQGIRPTKIEVIPNGIDFPKYNEIQTTKSTRPQLCYIGRLTKNKRVADIISAVKILQKKHPNILLKIIGKGYKEEKLQERKNKLKLDNNIEFLGYINNHKNVLKILASSQIFVSASILEGFGISVIEACALSVPYVITDIKPFIEITEGGQGGLIFRNKDIDDLANKIEELFKKEIYQQKKKEAINLAKSYDWRDIVEEHYEFKI